MNFKVSTNKRVYKNQQSDKLWYEVAKEKTYIHKK